MGAWSLPLSCCCTDAAMMAHDCYTEHLGAGRNSNSCEQVGPTTRPSTPLLALTPVHTTYIYIVLCMLSSAVTSAAAASGCGMVLGPLPAAQPTTQTHIPIRVPACRGTVRVAYATRTHPRAERGGHARGPRASMARAARYVLGLGALRAPRHVYI